MTDVFVARQPIFDPQAEGGGYELLFRDGAGATGGDRRRRGGDRAWSLNSFTEIGLERDRRRPARVDQRLTRVRAGRFCRPCRPAGLLEILEDQLIDDELIAAVEELKHEGYRLALDDFRYTPGATADGAGRRRQARPAGAGARGLARRVARLRPPGSRCWPRSSRPRRTTPTARSSGCELFQGYFFCRPELVRGRGRANRLSLLELLAALQDPAVELADLERMIARDLGLSYRLLRYINSAFFGLRQQVRSIGQALALLGVENLKHWAALSVFAASTQAGGADA